MATLTRPELAKSNKYWLSKHRFYELKHFCMQYQDWIMDGSDNSKHKIKLLKKVAYATDEILGVYILRGITSELSYEQLNARERIPCCKDTYYDLYRKFFWILAYAKENGGRIPRQETTTKENYTAEGDNKQE